MERALIVVAEPAAVLYYGVGLCFLMLLVHLPGLVAGAFDVRHGELGGRIPNPPLVLNAVQPAPCVLVGRMPRRAGP